MPDAFGIGPRSLGGGQPNIQAPIGQLLAGTRGVGTGYGGGFGSATAALLRKRMQYSAGFPGVTGGRPPEPGVTPGKGQPNVPGPIGPGGIDRVNRQFNLYQNYPGFDPMMLDPESFVRKQQRGLNWGRMADPATLQRLSDAAVAYRGYQPGQAMQGGSYGASFGNPDDALRRLLAQRMAAGGV